LAQFEALLVVTALCSLLVVSFLPVQPYFRWAALFFLILAFLLHAHYEILRLGLAGTYLAVAMLVLLLMFPLLLKHGLLLPGASVVLVLLLWSVASATIIPPLLAPAPKGPFLVGKIAPQIPVVEPPGAEYRRPEIEIWYPVDREQSGMPLTYERYYRRGGISGAPVSTKSPTKFPMLLYFSGGAGTGFDGGNIVRELVSWGYIVAVVSYPPSLTGLDSQNEVKRRGDFERDLFDFSPSRTFHETLAPIDNRIRDRAADATHVVDQITSLSQDTAVLQIRSRLASDQIGILGFSFGGSIAAEAKTLDPRFKAALNLDGWHFGSSVGGVPWPYLLMLSGESLDLNESIRTKGVAPGDYGAALSLRDLEMPITKMRTIGGYLLSISGTSHLNFSDCAFSGSIFRESPCAGKADKYKAFELMSKYTLAFFEAHLKNDMNSQRILNVGATNEPDFRFESWQPPREATRETVATKAQ
jgi:dienelactone hydrolase